ncbi:hypothetical protein MMC13_008448 [Lambiella insularis]|nr:hypothetical protein [Lambiella insularis]
MPLHRKHHHRRQFGALGNDLNTDISILEDGVKSVESNVATLVSVVYITATPTFQGPVGGYTTIVPVSVVQAPTFQSPAPVASTAAAESSALAISSALAQTFSSQSIALDTAATTATTAQAIASSSSLIDPIQGTTFSSSAPASPPSFTSSTVASSVTFVAAASATSSSSPAAITQDSTGLSGGAKAGIAIAIILGLAAFLAFLGFCYRRKKIRKNETYAVTEGEKNPFGDRAAVLAPARVSTPPQLSLRSPDELAITGAVHNGLESGDLEKAYVRESRSANPFGPHAEISPATQEVPAPLRIRTATPESMPLTAEAGIIAASTSATVAQRHNAPKPLEIKRTVSPASRLPVEGAMPSPSSTEYSMTSMGSAVVAGGPSPTNVHRIQLDFKPSMEDELELKAGQLVRLLHEYDDGWVSSPFTVSLCLTLGLIKKQALCIRLDRSQQGVAPRTCLSARPVKPRSKPSGIAPPVMRGPVQGSSQSSRHGSPVPVHHPPRSMSPGLYGGEPQQAGTSPSGGKARSSSVSDVRETFGSALGPSPMHPRAQALSQGTQNVVETPPQAAGVMTPTGTPLKPSQGMARKPVPGRTM